MQRRDFIGGILAAAFAPAFVKASSLMVIAPTWQRIDSFPEFDGPVNVVSGDTLIVTITTLDQRVLRSEPLVQQEAGRVYGMKRLKGDLGQLAFVRDGHLYVQRGVYHQLRPTT